MNKDEWMVHFKLLLSWFRAGSPELIKLSWVKVGDNSIFCWKLEDTFTVADRVFSPLPQTYQRTKQKSALLEECEFF